MAPDAEAELEGLGVTNVASDALQSAIVEAAELGPGEARRDLLGDYRRIAWELRTVNERVDAEAGQNALESALLQHRQAELQSALEDAGGALDAAGIARPASQDEAQESGDSPRKPGGKKRPKNLHPSAEPQATELEEFDMFSAADGQAPRGGDTGLVETERDRLIRLGVLTPFDDVRGFERRVLRTEVDPEASIRRAAAKMDALQRGRHTARLMDASELPQPERAPIRVEESYWKQGASQYVRPALKRRRKSRRLGASVDDEPDDTLAQDFEARRLQAAREAGRGIVGGRASVDDERPGAPLSPRSGSEERDTDASDGAPGSSPDPDSSPDPSPPKPRLEMVEFEGGFRMRGELYDSLFEYQRTAVKWLWELHTQRAGGILGDEMGLGKTVQVAAFLSGLVTSGLYRPSLIVCPATVLRQWLRELRAWAPELRVSVEVQGGALGEALRWPTGLVLTSYERLRLSRDALLPVAWGYVVLDEGHRIRNPDTDITLTAKQAATVHRLILTGAPIQNRLTELWSLFDFVFPGRLGTLPVFQAEFGLPIAAGGYANASALQVSTAYRCAVVLRDLVAPYLLRRRKSDVALALPPKSERVLFCTLTEAQRDVYRAYLASRDLRDIFEGRRAALAGIDILRKVCNHPDLLDRARWEGSEDYGAPARSGKMLVLDKILAVWSAQRHKVLVFTQTQQMLDIIEKMVIARNYSYHRMDGGTPVPQRAPLIDDFNANPDVFLFLLTTRVGGLGVNLTGADRVVVFDPDWNFSTDVQARERAWRIGQRREVTIYRFIVGGTIEEKIYHRQVYKHFLSDKVLRDPRQRRFFKSKDMQDLFTLGSEYQGASETAEMFTGAEIGYDAEKREEGAGAEQHLPVEKEENGEGTTELGPPASGPAKVAGEASPGDDDDASLRNIGLSAEEAAPAAEPAPDATSETALLKQLFEGAALHGALDHAAIEGANDPARLAIDREAGRVAKAAVEALRASRAALASAPISQPTWTGRFGGAAPPPAPRFGRPPSAAGERDASPSGSELLARMRARGGRASPSGRSSPAPQAADGAAQTAGGQRAQRIAAQVVRYLESVGGSAPSEAIIEQFGAGLPAADLPTFRGVLKSVANLRRVNAGRIWVLKQEFQGLVATE